MSIVSYSKSLEPTTRAPLADALAASGIDLATAELGPEPEGGGATAVLAARLVEWEELFDRESPAGVLLGGDDDTALAAALSAAKLELPVFALEAGSLVRLLASAASEERDPGRAATEIAAWAGALPTLSGR
jgi:UDP-N-acetylglucosamine 2-epimerase